MRIAASGLLAVLLSSTFAPAADSPSPPPWGPIAMIHAFGEVRRAAGFPGAAVPPRERFGQDPLRRPKSHGCRCSLLHSQSAV